MVIKAILFDLIGTTVLEKEPGTINRSFKRAFADHGVNVTDDVIRAGRGLDKREMITATLKKLNLGGSLVDPILASLQNHISNDLDNFSTNNDVHETFNILKEMNVKIGIGSGLPRDTFEKILLHLQWDKTQLNYIGIAEEMKHGRPHPDMIMDMLGKLELKPSEVLKVGDTVADIQEGKNAGVFTAAILSGTQPSQELFEQYPDFIIHSIEQVKGLVTSCG